MARLENSAMACHNTSTDTHWLWRLAAEILFGEEVLRGSQPAKPPKPGRKPRASGLICPFAAQEGGTVSLATVVVVMIIVVLSCLVVNTGIATVEKVELQNGADSLAYSEALWMARGMNTITAANHLIGEATALAVVLDAFGGPEQDDGGNLDDGNFSNLQNIKLKVLKDSTFAYADPVPFDAPLVNAVVELFTKDDGKHQAGAMIYDSYLTLKFTLQLGLAIKSVCTLVSRLTVAIPVVNVIVKGVTLGIHIAIDALIVKMAQEWIFIKGIEFASKGTPVIKRTLREALIPAMCEYADFVAGREAGGEKFANDKAGGSPIERAAGDTINRLAAVHKLDSAAVFSAGKKWRLPVIPEPAPKISGAVSQPPSEWNGDDWDGPFEALNKLAKKINGAISRVTKYFELLSKWTSFGLLDFAIPDDWKPSAFAKKLNIDGGPDDKGFTSNPSRKKLPKFDWQGERRDQYTRATYPMVDSLRAPVRNFCKDTLSISNASTWFIHWTNRYTSVEVHNRRTSESSFATGKAHVYLMRDSSPKQKGYEPWAVENDPAKGNSAEQIFTLIAFAWRQKGETVMGAPLFKNPNTEGRLTYSMAMFYNANGRKVPKSQPAAGMVQPNTGWDTLNWAMPVNAPEWGADPRDGADSGLWTIITGDVPANSSARIKLNWQAKLMPITESRLLKAVGDADLPDEIGKSAKIIERFPELIHH